MFASKASLALLVPLGALLGCSGELNSGSMEPDGTPSGLAPFGTDGPGAPGASIGPGEAAPGGTLTMPPGTLPAGPLTTPENPDGISPEEVPPQTTPEAPPPEVATGEAVPVRYDGAPQHLRFVRLTHTQWENSVQQLLALSGPTGFTDGFPQDAIVGGFSNDENGRYVTQTLNADYEAAAEALAAEVTADTTSLGRVYEGTDAAGFIAAFGRRAYRRPLSPDEVSAYQAVYEVGEGLSGTGTAFQKGAGLVIQAMLQSPYFLYRVELGDEGTPLDGYEVVTKLSLALRDIAPSDALLDAAERGDYDDPEALGTLAGTMLGEEGVTDIFRSYHGELFGFQRYANIEKAEGAVDNYTPELNTDLQEASYLFFDRIFAQDLGVADIYTSTTGYANTRMAPLYGVTPPSVGFGEFDLGAARAGYFTQAPYLILHSVNATPHSILRGVDLNLKALCVSPGVPVAGVELVDAQPGGTNRQRVEESTSAEVCATCHANYINPLGFAFENFDGMGQQRDLDNGNPIDTSGSYPFTEGRLPFEDAAGLMQLMAVSEQAHTCYAKHLSEFVLSRQLDDADRETVENLRDLSMNKTSLKSLIVEIVKSPQFRTRFGGGQ
jgi:hypothetical protein